MTRGRARIDSPEVIREFRRTFAKFEVVCRNALMSFDSEVNGTIDWLRADRRSHWKRELRKYEEAVTRAQQEYSQARWEKSYRRTEGVDEKRALEKAKRRKEEAERKVALVKKWTGLLSQSVEKMTGPCRTLMVLLDTTAPRALSRLDQLVERLEEYFAEPPKEES